MFNFIDILKTIMKGQATEYIKAEEKELEHVFALLLLGSFIGLPAPPAGLVLHILPSLGPELLVLEKRAVNDDDFFGQMAGLFDI
ncbi:MAG: hypothetical protein ACOCQN_00525 [Halanaerobiaceae bacterium]